MAAKEKYTELYEKAALLGNQTRILRQRSILYYVSFSMMLVFLLLFSLVMIFSILPTIGEDALFIKYLCIVFLFALITVIMKWEQSLSKKTRDLYERVQQLCVELSDMIDWTTMRKRQIYKSLEPELQKPIDEFYIYSISRACPFYGGRALRNLMLIVFMIEALGIFAYSLLAFIH